MTGPLVKLRQDSGTAPGCVSNTGVTSNCTNGGSTVWTNPWLLSCFTEGEFADFQVHWHDTGSGTTGLKITVSNFVQSSPNSYTINCATLGQCIVYREVYMDVTIPSSAAATYYNATGFYPDTLIPATDPYWGQTTNAWPFTVAAGKNQSAWIDVLIPTAAPSGFYSGTVTVQTGCPSSCTTVATLPVILAVWQWPASGNMPTQATLLMDTEVWSYNGLCTQMYSPNSTSNTTLCGSYPGSGGGNDGGVTQTSADGGMLLKDHRSSGGVGYNIFPGSGSFSSFNTTGGPMLNGTCNLHAGAGTTCPILPSSKMNVTELASTGSQPYPSATVSNWQSNFDTNGWGTAGHPPLSIKLCDEPPNGCSWATLVSNATTYRGYLSTGVPLLVTTDYNSANSNSATTSIDWMAEEQVNMETDPTDCPPSGCTNFPPSSWLTGSTNNIPRQFWTYSDCQEADSCSNGTTGGTFRTYPNRHIDGLPVPNRAQEWNTYRVGATGELYYAADICMVPVSQGANCGYPTHNFDPWQSVYYSGGWGDGTLVQVGQGSVSSADNYLGTGVTTPIILPTIRLKHQRDGEQDYEYLYLLNQKGKGSVVNAQIAKWLTNTYTFNTNPTAATGTFTGDFMDSRNAIGLAMHQLSFGTVYVAQTAGTFTGGTLCNGQTAITPTSIVWSLGNTYVICGTITFGTNVAGLTVGANGTATNPIIIQFDNGGILQSPQFKGGANGPAGPGCCTQSGGIVIPNGTQYVIIDGGTNGIIQNTANGNGMTNNTSSLGIYDGGDYTKIRNLTIKQIYQWPSGPVNSNLGGMSADIWTNTAANYLQVCNNTLLSAQSGLQVQTANTISVTYTPSIDACSSNSFSNTPNIDISYNFMDDHAWMMVLNGSGQPLVHNNQMGTMLKQTTGTCVPGNCGWFNWTADTADFHEDGLFLTGHGSSVFKPQIFWNYFQGDTSAISTTTGIYMTYVPGQDYGGQDAIYRNVCFAPNQGAFTSSDQGNTFCNAFATDSVNINGPHKIYNNTITGATNYGNNGSIQGVGIDFQNNIFQSNNTVGSIGFFFGNGSSGQVFAANLNWNNNVYSGSRQAVVGPNGGFDTWASAPVGFAAWQTQCSTHSPPATGCDSASLFNTSRTYIAFVGQTLINSDANISDGSNFYLSATSPARGVGANLTSQCTTLIGLCTGPPQFFGPNSSCGSGCKALPATGAWDVGAYPFVSVLWAPGPNGRDYVNGNPLNGFSYNNGVTGPNGRKYP